MKKKSSKLTFLWKRKFTHSLLAVFLSLLTWNVCIAAEPFNCNDGIAYQTINNTTAGTSELQGYDVTTGARTFIATLPYVLNGLIYNTVDNMLWASRTGTNNIVRIDREGGTTSFPIIGLPSGLNVGAELPSGYMLLYNNNHTHYYVVDVDSSRVTYLQMVDPTAGFALQTGPEYGIEISTPAAISDMAFISTKQLFYGITTSSEIATLDPLTGDVVVGAAISGLPASGNYGALFSDASGKLYAFLNGSGAFYKIDIAANTATLISTSSPSGNNDGASCPNTILVDLPFTCNDGIAYQTINSIPDNTSALHGFDVTTGAKTLIATLPYILNGLIYNSVDNMLWASITGSNSIVKIDREGGAVTYPIANLPSGSNVGAELPSGYMLLYSNNGARYYVVDVDPNRATYLQLVDPTAGFALQTGPDYGTEIINPVHISDIAFVSNTQLCYGITTESKIASLDPFTGILVVEENTITGLPSTGNYGAIFSDVSGRLYAFHNGLGSFYLVHPSTNTGSLISTSAASGNNDGASCANTNLADLPFACEDGITYQVAATSGDTTSSLYGFNVSTGIRTLIAPLPYSVNGLIYNSVDNMLWGSVGTSLVRIDQAGGTKIFPIANLPVANLPAELSHYNVATELPGGYMMLYRYVQSAQQHYYYVIDLDPSRATYLQLVDPTAGFALKTGPNYGTLVNSPSAFDIADIAFVSSSQLSYGIRSDGVLVSLDPFTGNAVFGATPVNGLPTGTFGAVVSDITGRLYAFHNSTGSYYRVDIATNSATLISTSTPSGNNDGASCANTVTENLPFTCNDGITYQTVAVSGNPNSSLYALNVSTGVRTLIAPMPYQLNALIYNSSDNMLWAAVNGSNRIVKIDREGGVAAYTIANLPVGFFNIGVELPNGYMMLTTTNSAEYYVVDIDATRSTYLQLVDPKAGFVLKTGPNYGTAVSGPLDISDIAFVSGAQLAYGLTSQAKLASLNPLTGNVVVDEMSVNGLPAGAYGAVVTDATGHLYAFNNNTGRFYKINVESNTANLIATFTPSGGNDGANCSTATLCDLSLTISTAPTQAVCIESNVTFAVTASGTGPFSYQWQVSPDSGSTWTDLSLSGETTVNGTYSGAGTGTLSVAPASLTWSGNQYRVNVGNGDCTMTSDNSSVEIFEVPGAPVVSDTIIQLQCPIITADLTTLVTSPTPLGSTLGFYTSLTPSEATRVVDPTQAVEGTYYAFYINGGCASSTKITVTGCSLPVTLASFTIAKEESGVQGIALLNWTTTSETNSDHFEIQRSRNGKNWSKIGSVASNGESTGLKSYAFSDTKPLAGENLYRLKMVDLDGTFAYSSIRSASFENVASVLAYPNPTTDRLLIKDYDLVKHATLHNRSGMKVLDIEKVSSDGIAVKHLIPGMYILRMTLADGTLHTSKVVISK